MSRPSQEALSSLTGIFSQLSDSTRLRLVLLLATGERNVGSLCEELKLRQPTVSHHLGLLRMNRLIVAKRDGKQIIYALGPNFKIVGGKLKISLPECNVTVEGI